MNLPVEQIREQLVASFSGSDLPRVLLKAPTGSGKSTAVPSMLLESGIEGLIVVIQPRRIAARMLATRVAQLRGAQLGKEVGYVVRFEHRMSPETRIVYVTDGMFQNWLKSNPKLDGIGAVLFDEFHERRLDGDIALAKCLELQEQSRKDLHLTVMSATIELAEMSAYMAPCRELVAEGRSYPVAIEYSAPQRTSGPQHRQPGLPEQCVKAVREAIFSEDAGHILIFLPGVYEIRKTVRLLEEQSLFRHWNICPLYSALSPKLQDEAVSDSARPKIIVSTNVAETSLTIDGVRTVIDAGYARVSSFDPRRGINTLMVQPISQAAADQRAGRAGRTAPGRCIRLWSHTSHAKRIPFELPEVKRVDLAEVMLQLKSEGQDVRSFRWIDFPEMNAIEQAEKTLTFLGAIDPAGELTERGAQMAKFSLAPRFSRFLLAADEFHCLAEVAFIVAAMQGDSLFLKRGGDVRREDYVYDEDDSDFVSESRAFQAAQNVDFQPKRCSMLGISSRTARDCQLQLKQVAEQCERSGLSRLSPNKKLDFGSKSDTISQAAIVAFGDNMGVRFSTSTLACRLLDGRNGKLDAASAVKNHALFVATDLTEVEGREVVVYLNRCIGVSMELLQDKFSDKLEVAEEVEFNVMSRRVERRLVTKFTGLVVDAKVGGSPDPQLASSLLAERVASGELVLKHWDKSVEQWIARLNVLREAMPELELPCFSEEDKALALEQVCEGAVSYKDIKNREVLDAVRSWLSAGQQAALDAYAPTEIQLSNGKKTKVYYEEGKNPWIAMQAQRLFGVDESPTIAGGNLKLTIHICAPNGRPWQITDDLAGFWASGFEQMRKDLAGRYPKHQWTLDI